MGDIKITTNNVPRDVLSGHDLTAAERAEIGYRDWSEPDGDGWDGSYVRFKGCTYDLGGEVERVPDGMFGGEQWDGYKPESFFSGVLFRYERDERGAIDGERIICASYYVRG
jgi:hypothetical protein